MKKLAITLVIIIGLIVAYWLGSPLFFDKHVYEDLPTSTGYDSPPGTPVPEPVVLARGTFAGTDAVHQGSGAVTVIRVGRQNYLRFEEDFRVTNGPDLFVYLGKEGKVDPLLSLGELKGNIGSQNYVLPVDASILDTNEVVIWCRAFDVNFAIAKLTLEVTQDEYLNN